jgi:EmrB/QacA subfamily drug resistance transporter
MSSTSPDVLTLPPTADTPLAPAAASAAQAGRTPLDAPPLSVIGLMTVLIGVLLPMTDFFIVNVALPTMQTDLNSSTALLELVVSGYATAYAVLLVIGGRLGDAHGRRRMFLVGMAAFTVASFLCGVAPTAATLVIARVVQGAAAAMMVPQTLSTIQATGNLESRSRALGWFGAAGGVAAVTGQVLGGVLITADIGGSGWRAIFFVNIPIGIIGLVLAARFVPETQAARAHKIDIRGTILLAVTLAAVLIPLTEGRALGWPVWAIALLLLAPVGAAAFVAVERRLEQQGGSPLVPPSILEHSSMRRGLPLVLPFFGSVAAFMFVYALLIQGIVGFSPLRAGVTLAPMAVAFLFSSLATTRLVARHGRNVISWGAGLQCVGLLLVIGAVISAWPDIHSAGLIPGLVVMGFGQGLVMSPMIRVVLSEVPVEAAGAGSGVLTTTQQTAFALGVATLGSLFISLAPHNRLGPLHATVLVLGIEAFIAATLVPCAQLLPGRATAKRRPA